MTLLRCRCQRAFLSEGCPRWGVLEGRKVDLLKADLVSFLSVSVSLEQLGQLGSVYLLCGGSGGVESFGSLGAAVYKTHRPCSKQASSLSVKRLWGWQLWRDALALPSSQSSVLIPLDPVPGAQQPGGGLPAQSSSGEWGGREGSGSVRHFAMRRKTSFSTALWLLSLCRLNSSCRS